MSVASVHEHSKSQLSKSKSEGGENNGLFDKTINDQINDLEYNDKTINDQIQELENQAEVELKKMVTRK